MKVYVLLLDEDGCCHLTPPAGVFMTFAAAAEHGKAWMADPQGIGREAFDVIELEADIVYASSALWPRFKSGHSSVPFVPTEAMKPDTVDG